MGKFYIGDKYVFKNGEIGTVIGIDCYGFVRVRFDNPVKIFHYPRYTIEKMDKIPTFKFLK